MGCFCRASAAPPPAAHAINLYVFSLRVFALRFARIRMIVVAAAASNLFSRRDQRLFG
jgi:hypothetical protein